MVDFARFLPELFSPIVITLVVSLAAVAFLLAHKVRWALSMLTSGVIILLYCGGDFGVRDAIEKREYSFLPLTGERLEMVLREKVDKIVILGSGHVSDQRLPATSQLGSTSLYRLTEGIRIARMLPDSTLVVLGYGGSDKQPNAEVVSRAAVLLGFPESMVISLPEPQDTIEEAKQAFSVVGQAPFILVTSAMHMTRAMEVFRDQAMHPIPAPTDYIIKKRAEQPKGFFQLPTAANFDLRKRLIYEWMASKWLELHLHLKKSQ